MLHFLDYTTRKTEDAAGINTSKLTAKRDFIALNTEVEKLDFNRQTNTLCINKIWKKNIWDIDKK